MNIYQRINALRKHIRILEEEEQKAYKAFVNKYQNNKYESLPFKPGTMQLEEQKLIKLSAGIRELRKDLNRIVYQQGEQKVIDWYLETQE